MSTQSEVDASPAGHPAVCPAEPQIQGTSSGRACFATLPGELILQIASDPCLSHQDRKSLRLVCRAIIGVVGGLVFRRLRISRLKEDRDCFFRIASTPHLAALVREVVWSEITEDEMTFMDYHEYLQTGLSSEVFNDILAQIREVFWLPSLPDRNPFALLAHPRLPQGKVQDMVPALVLQAIADRRKDIIDEFTPRFFAALNKLTHLHTFISRPMAPNRVLSREGYPTEAQLLQSMTGTTAAQMNDGLFQFLLPAMMRPESNITRLFWADEGVHPSLLRLKPAHAPAFTKLTTIELCLGHDRHDLPKEFFDVLALCLRTATGLRELTICFEKGHVVGINVPIGTETDEDRTAGLDIFARLCCQQPPWPLLTSLHITDLQFPQSSMIKFLKLHAPTLRHLRIDRRGLEGATICELAAIPEIKLDSITITESGGYAQVDEADLLGLVNGTNPAAADIMGRYRIGRHNFFSTHYAIFDRHGWPTAAYFDAISPTKYRHYYTIEDRSALATEYGAGPTGCDEEASMSGSSADDESIAYYGDADSETEDSQDHRERTASHWNWGQLRHSLDVYFWRVDPNEPSSSTSRCHQTKTWRFRRANGDTAYGADPLEFFSDWDSDAGDTAEATPYGRELTSFVRYRNISGAPSNYLDKPVPEGAVRYGKQRDPLDPDFVGWNTSEEEVEKGEDKRRAYSL